MKKSSWPGVLAAGLGIGIALTWVNKVDTQLPRAAQSTPAYEAAVQQALPTETWRIVLPTPTTRPWYASTPTAVPTADLYSTAPCGCSYDAYNCADFKDALGNQNPDGAQLCFNYCLDKTGTDVHHLVQDSPWDAYINTAWVCTDGRIKAESSQP